MNGRLKTEMIKTFSLQELLTLVESEISVYAAQKKEYSERLGNFLRTSKKSIVDQDWLEKISLQGKFTTEEEKKSISKKKRKMEKPKDEWIPFKNILLTSSVKGEAELMFEVIEAITKKIEKLGEAKSSIEELRSVGLGDEVSYTILLQEGVPKKIVIKPSDSETGRRFTFNKVFTINKHSKM